MNSLRVLAGILMLSAAGNAWAQNVTVNPGAGSYPDLKTAFDRINDGTHTGAITISVVGDTTETVPAVLNGSGSGLATYTSVLLTPVGNRTITGAIVAGSPMIDLNGADNVTINGLNSAGNTLTIANTTVSATSGTSTIRIQGDGTGNTITNANIQGSATMAVGTNGGNIWIGSAAVTTGNDNNTISNNNIGPAGTNLPTKGVYFTGTSNTLANNGCVVTGNNIFDYFGAAVTSAGVYVSTGTPDATISNNRFYQTATRTQTTGAQHSAIQFANTGSVNAQTVTGNIIGFASAAGTGTYNFVGVASSTLVPIALSVGTTVPSSVQGNTITAIAQSGASAGTSSSASFRGIYVSNGLVNVGDITGNTIGSLSSNGAITFTSSSTAAADVIGIFNFGSSSFVSNNNNIGGITVSNSSTGAANLYGLRANTSSTQTWTALNNTIGGTLANSMQSNSTATGTTVQGILNSNPAATLTGNTIRNLTAAGGTGTGTTASVIGISLNAGSASHVLTSNTIHSLTNTNAAAATVVSGIQMTGSTANIVQRNLIHSLVAASATAVGNGIDIRGGTTVYRNNFIRLGQDALGVDVTAGVAFSGINEFLGTNTVVNNSVLINGSGTLGTANTFAFNGQQTVNVRSFQNNNFFNARSNGAGTGKHYAIRVGGTTPNPAGLTSNYNNIFANGTGGVFGLFNAIDQADLATWQASTGQDANSISVNPAFVSFTDLHLTGGSPSRNVGLVIGSVTNDFDGDSRPGANALYDIGADEFDGIPAVAYDLQATAFIDPANGGSKLTGASFGPQASFTNNGTNNQAGVTVRYRILDAGAVEIYNQTAIIASINSGTTTTVTFPSTSIASTGAYSIVARAELAGDTVAANDQINGAFTVEAPLAGTYTVGTGGNYASLTNPAGAFQALNNLGASANVTLNIISDLNGETGANALNQLAPGISVRIQPFGAPRVVTGSSAAALITLNGADNVTIEGSLTGATAADVVGGNASLRNLSFVNTNAGTSAGVLLIATGATGAQNNVVRNLNVIGQDPLTTLLGISVGGATLGTSGADNDNVRIENCSVQKSIFGIYAVGTSGVNPNLGNVITKNDLSATAGNRIRRVGIFVANQDGVEISLNQIGGIETNESADAVGIAVGSQGLDATSTTSGGVVNALVSRNRINGVASLSTTGFSAAGITVAGGTPGPNTIVNNMVSGVTAPSTSPDLVAGIYVVGATGAVTRLYYNSVALSGDRGAVATQMPGYGIAITGTDPTVELKNNIFSTTQIASGGGVNAKAYAIGMVSTTFANLDANFNVYNSAGANAGFFRSGSLSAGAGLDYATLALWQAAIGDDANSVFGDPLFVSDSDLHLQGASPALNIGTPIGSVTIDIDGDSRSATLPDIGADEVPPPNTAPTITPTKGGLTRQAGSAGSNSQIATVNDAEQPIGSLVVTAPGVPAGLEVTGIVNSTGNITANVTATCTASTGVNLVGLSVSDGSLSGTGDLTVNVSANSAPTLGTYGSTTLVAGNGTTVTPTAAPTDNGSVALLTAAAPGFTGTFMGNPATGVITITNAGPASLTPYVVTVTAVDNCDAISTATFNLTVEAPNTAPSITPVKGGLTRQQGSAASNSTIASVSDNEQSAGSLIVTAPTVPAGLSVASIVNSTGTVTADVGASCTATTGANLVGLNVSDGLLDTAGELAVNVTANSAPVLGAYGAATVTAGSGTTVTPGAAPTDNGSVVSLAASAPGFTGTLVGNPATGVVTVANAGPVAGSPFTVTVVATDNCGATSMTTFQLTVNALNTPPSITPAVGLTRQIGSTASSSTIATVSDAESSAGSLTVTAPSIPAGLTLTNIVNTDGTVTASLAATCSATAGSNTVGLDVSDGGLNTAASLGVEVTANSAPVQGTYAGGSVAANGSGNFSPSAAPTDNGSVVTLTASAPGFTGTFVGNPVTGVISVSNAGPTSGSPFTVTVTATDNCGATSTTTFSLVVQSTATTLTLSGPTLVRINQPITYTFDLQPTTATGTVTISSGALSCQVTVPTATPSCALTFPTTGARTVSAAYVPADSSFLASSSNVLNVTVNFFADLEVTKTNGVSTFATVGELRVYTLTLRNLGPDQAPNVVFTDVVPTTLTTVTWTCVASGGAACPQANGTGNINATVATLPASGQLTYTLQGNVASPLPTEIVNTAQVSLTGLPINDSVLTNNSATDRDLPNIIFQNGFEASVLLKIAGLSGGDTLPMAELLPMMDATARVLLGYEDASGEALRVYGRINAGTPELALAIRGSDGLLHLSDWTQVTGAQARLNYQAEQNGRDYQLRNAQLK